MSEVITRSLVEEEIDERGIDLIPVETRVGGGDWTAISADMYERVERVRASGLDVQIVSAKRVNGSLRFKQVAFHIL